MTVTVEFAKGEIRCLGCDLSGKPINAYVTSAEFASGFIQMGNHFERHYVRGDDLTVAYDYTALMYGELLMNNRDKAIT